MDPDLKLRIKHHDQDVQSKKTETNKSRLKKQDSKDRHGKISPTSDESTSIVAKNIFKRQQQT